MINYALEIANLINQQTSGIKITVDMVLHWLGSDHDESELYTHYLDLKSGYWTPESAQREISSLWEDEE